jgi:hypothetical protein
LVPNVETEDRALIVFAFPSGASLDQQAKPERSWQDIVAEAATASRQHKLERLADLRKELEVVLSGRNEALRAEVKSDKPPAKNKIA